MFAAILAGPEMSPDAQWNYVAEKIDRLIESNEKQFSDLRQQQKEDRHAIRNEMQTGFGKLQMDLQSLRTEQWGTDRRLLVVETERKSEEGAAAKRATWISLGIGLVWSIFQFLFGWMDKRG